MHVFRVGIERKVSKTVFDLRRNQRKCGRKFRRNGFHNQRIRNTECSRSGWISLATARSAREKYDCHRSFPASEPCPSAWERGCEHRMRGERKPSASGRNDVRRARRLRPGDFLPGESAARIGPVSGNESVAGHWAKLDLARCALRGGEIGAARQREQSIFFQRKCELEPFHRSFAAKRTIVLVSGQMTTKVLVGLRLLPGQYALFSFPCLTVPARQANRGLFRGLCVVKTHRE